jgi:soluble lytic murein transglycosylase-like protein
MACKFDLRDVIIGEANAQGVPPEIALAVAADESKICHWAPNGSVLRGRAGEYGVFQLMPATAASLGVDPTDVDDNIHGGVKYLRQLYDRYGNWSLAVQHYNGSGSAAQNYAARVMGIARGYGYGLAIQASSSGSSSYASGSAGRGQPSISKTTLIAAGIVAGAGLLAFAFASS